MPRLRSLKCLVIFSTINVCLIMLSIIYKHDPLVRSLKFSVDDRDLLDFSGKSVPVGGWDEKVSSSNDGFHKPGPRSGDLEVGKLGGEGKAKDVPVGLREDLQLIQENLEKELRKLKETENQEKEGSKKGDEGKKDSAKAEKDKNVMGQVNEQNKEDGLESDVDEEVEIEKAQQEEEKLREADEIDEEDEETENGEEVEWGENDKQQQQNKKDQQKQEQDKQKHQQGQQKQKQDQQKQQQDQQKLEQNQQTQDKQKQQQSQQNPKQDQNKQQQNQQKQDQQKKEQPVEDQQHKKGPNPETKEQSQQAGVGKPQAQSLSASSSIGSAPDAGSSKDQKDLPLCPEVPPGLVGEMEVNMVDVLEHEKIKELNPGLQPGGRWKPSNCTARHRVAIVIPYRERDAHAKILLNNLHPMLMRQQLDYGVYIIQQSLPGYFNRAMLMNIGYVEAMKRYDYQCVVFHDVDLVPENDRNIYSCPKSPRHLSVAVDKFKYRVPYKWIFGGATVFTKEQFERVNGYSNMYFGWGAEDDDMALRLEATGQKPIRYPPHIARYKMISHGREKTNPRNPKRYNLRKDAKSRMPYDGLNNLVYTTYKTLVNATYTKVVVYLDRRKVIPLTQEQLDELNKNKH